MATDDNVSSEVKTYNGFLRGSWTRDYVHIHTPTHICANMFIVRMSMAYIVNVGGTRHAKHEKRVSKDKVSK